MAWRIKSSLSVVAVYLLLNSHFALADSSFFRDCEHCPEMANVLAGTLTWVGNSTDSPLHRNINVQGFFVGRREVSRAEFQYFLERTGYTVRGSWQTANADKLPVVGIDLFAVQAYVRWLTRRTGKPYRLLTETEWEYASRGGSKTRYWWGDDEKGACTRERLPEIDYQDDQLCGRATYEHDPDDEYFTSLPSHADEMRNYAADNLAPTGSLLPNPFGLYDMLGNAAEWVMTCDKKTNACQTFPDEIFIDKNKTGIRIARDAP